VLRLHRSPEESSARPALNRGLGGGFHGGFVSLRHRLEQGDARAKLVRERLDVGQHLLGEGRAVQRDQDVLVHLSPPNRDHACLAARQPQAARGDDVALNLAGPRRDRAGDRGHVAHRELTAQPRPAWRLGPHLAMQPHDPNACPGHALRQFGVVELGHRGFFVGYLAPAAWIDATR